MKTIHTLLLLGLVTFPAIAVEHEQRDAELPVWQPAVGEAPDFSEAAQTRYREWVEETYEDPADADNFWEIIGWGCSWYCGAWYDSLDATSTLEAQDDFTYDADNAHDLRYDTAWVEGVDGPGIGEALTYRFANESPRITEIIIHNGYIKSLEAWLNNNRVRSLRLRINGEPIALLSLADERGAQSFDLEALGLGPLGRRNDGEDLVLAFEIVDVYPGEKYDDTAITEIYFDGIDVH